MADLVTRIIADDKQFSDKIEKSKKTVKGFSDEANKAGNSAGGFDKKLGSLAGGALTKLIGGFGAAATAGAAFKKIIDSSQTSADKFQMEIGAAKTTLDQFFKSVSTGDFTNFINGLGHVIDRARDAEAALDQLWNTQLSYSVMSSKVGYGIMKARTTAMDNEATPEERKKALSDWEAMNQELRGYSTTLQEEALNTAKKIVQTYNTLSSESFGYDDLVEVFKIDLTSKDKRDEIKEEVFAQYKEYTEAVKQAKKDAEFTYKKATTVGGRTTYNQAKGFKQGQFDEDLKRLNEQYKHAILTYSMLEKAADEGDKELSGIAKRVELYQATGQQIENMDYQFVRAKNRVNKQIEKELNGDNKIKIDKIEIIPQGSIAELDKKLQEARKAFANATTDEARVAANLLVKELETKKAVIDIQLKYSDPGEVGRGSITPVKAMGKFDAIKEVARLNAELTKAEGKLERAFDAESIKKAGAEVKKIKEDIEAVSGQHNIKIEVKGSGDGYPDTGDPLKGIDLNIPGAWNDLMDEMYKKNQNTINSFYGMGDALGNIGNMLGENGGQWLSWAGNILTSIGQAIPALTALTAAKGASSVAEVPVVGPVLAIGAIASILAAFASIPKFAMGGIVPGTSFTGDKMLARVNSGEAILNTSQQANLFKILNDGRPAGGITAGRVKFEIEGKKLVGILNNEGIRSSRL